MSLEDRVKAIEDSDRTLNQATAEAVIELQKRVARLEASLTAIATNPWVDPVIRTALTLNAKL
jgi:hypothetical protein